MIATSHSLNGRYARVIQPLSPWRKRTMISIGCHFDDRLTGNPKTAIRLLTSILTAEIGAIISADIPVAGDAVPKCWRAVYVWQWEWIGVTKDKNRVCSMTKMWSVASLAESRIWWINHATVQTLSTPNVDTCIILPNERQIALWSGTMGSGIYNWGQITTHKEELVGWEVFKWLTVESWFGWFHKKQFMWLYWTTTNLEWFVNGESFHEGRTFNGLDNWFHRFGIYGIKTIVDNPIIHSRSMIIEDVTANR